MTPHGPHDPTTTTPTRRPGSVRRTTSIDVDRSGFVARGRDLLTRADGSTVVLDQVELRGSTAPTGELLSLDASPPLPDLAGLVGLAVGRGFRARAAQAVPAPRAAGTVLHLLLDDLPLATLVSGYGEMRELPAMAIAPATADRMLDLCAGWQGGATMMQAIEQTGLLPTPIGPPAPELARADDPLAWHDLPPLGRGELRRRRRLDVTTGNPLLADAMFRDSHRALDGEESVLHEYEVSASIDPLTLVVRHAEAAPRVLPWPECPQAAASAARIAGEPVAALRERVLDDLTGIGTCTHLNDLLRSLADVSAMAEVLG